MSVNYYNQRWEECINDLTEQIEDEGIPLSQQQRTFNAKKTDVERFQYYGTLYIKYIDIYRKLEDCYDQLTHPQKRALLKEMLVNTMIRMCEIKQNVVKFSTQTNIVRSDFINFDELVMDLKMTPKCLEVPIPRYFVEEDKKRIEQRNTMISRLMEQIHDTSLPEDEILVESLQLETNMQTAVRIIQKLQRGRQGILRVMEAFKLKKAMGLKRKHSVQEEENEELKQDRMVVILQKYCRAYEARRKFQSLREGELTFLGIVKQYDKDNVQKVAQQNRLAQKKIQIHNEDMLTEDKERIREEIRAVEGGNMRTRMLDERRKWIRNYLFMSDFRLLPNKALDFYKLDKNSLPQEKSPKKKKSPAKEESPKKKLAKSKAIINADNHIPSELVVKIQDNIEQHTKNWSSRQESSMFSPVYDINMVKKQLRPDVQKDIQQMVDAMIGLELDNMRIKYGIRKKKEKRKKKAKKKSTKKVKIPFGLGKRDPRDLVAQLVELKIIKFLKPAHMSEFKGETNPLGSLQQRLSEVEPDPSYAQLRQVIIETIAIPLGSSLAKERLDKKSWFLFYGPTGTGKTLMIRSIQTECNCMVIDLSPDNLEGKFTDKKQLKRIFWISIILAKKYQPTLILIEDVETIFQSKKKKKKEHFFGVKLKKGLMQMKKNRYWEKTDRIAVIGCSNRPYNGNIKLIKRMFHKYYYFPYPNYATRKLLFESFLADKLGKSPQNFPYSTICQISEGFTAGSYKQAIDRVLTEQRIKRLDSEPLKLSEFIVPLSNTYCTYAEEYQKLKTFMDEITGMRERREQKQRASLVESVKKGGKK